MSIYRNCEWADDYPNVVATFGPTMRLIVARNGFGWTLQKRRAKAGRWFQVAALLRFKRNLAELVMSHMHSRHAAEHGITLATVEEALSALPERFTDGPTHTQLVINTPATRRTEPTSYKTENDHRFDRDARGQGTDNGL